MCPPKDKSGQIAREQAKRNQARIDAGTARVDEVFGRFGDPFFEAQEDAYTQNFLPQLDRQFDRAHETSVKRLAGRGQLDGSAGARVLGDLQRQFQSERAGIASRAFDHSRRTRGNLESARSGVLQQVRAGAAPAEAASQARVAASQASAQGDFSPLGDVFADAINQFGTAALLQQRGFAGTGIDRLNPARQTAGSSSRVVR